MVLKPSAHKAQLILPCAGNWPTPVPKPGGFGIRPVLIPAYSCVLPRLCTIMTLKGGFCNPRQADLQVSCEPDGIKTQDENLIVMVDRRPSLSLANAFVALEKVSLTYGSGEKKVQALENTELSVMKGDFVALVGPSG